MANKLFYLSLPCGEIFDLFTHKQGNFFPYFIYKCHTLKINHLVNIFQTKNNNNGDTRKNDRS